MTCQLLPMLGAGFTMEFTFGNAITILVGIVGFAAAWGKWKADTEAIKQAVKSKAGGLMRSSGQEDW